MSKESFISKPMDEIEITVAPTGALTVLARSLQVLETPSKIVELSSAGIFREGTRVTTNDPVCMVVPGITMVQSTDL